MSDAIRWSHRWSRWRQTWTRWGHVLERRLSLDRWYPQVPIALATAPLGMLLIANATRRSLGVAPWFVELADLERRANAVGHAPLVEAAIGLSLIAISMGLAARSRLAWLWAIGGATMGLSIRLFERHPDRLFVGYLGALLLALLLYRHRFRGHNLASSSLFAITAIATFLLWATLATLRLGSHFAPPIHDAVTALYFTVITVSSVGFGDVVANDDEARLFVAAMVVLGIVVNATAFSAILLPLMAGRFRQALGGRADLDRSNHYVIVGKSPLARNTTIELENRGQRVTLVLERTPEEEFYKQRDVVVGDATDLTVLRSAGTERAKGVLALSTDDADNGFVVLGVNEINAEIRTVAALNDPKNEARLKRTQPSMLLSLQSLGGELLAMAMTGEHVDVQVLSRVLQLPSVGGGPPK